MELFFASIFVLIIALVMLFAGKLFGPRGDNPSKREPFECGVEPLQKGVPRNFSIHYFRVALLFLVFDIEIAFLVPWALAFRKNPVVFFIVVLVFQIFVLLALVYAWKKGDLEWEK